jgi:hypothetical protein
MEVEAESLLMNQCCSLQSVKDYGSQREEDRARLLLGQLTTGGGSRDPKAARVWGLELVKSDLARNPNLEEGTSFLKLLW